MTKILDTQLSNGMPATYISVPGLTTMTVLVLVRAGLYCEDSKTNGISHFLEHVCFKGTEKMSGRELMKHLDSLGAETNAFTSEEFTGFYAKGSPDHARDYVASIFDIFTNPIFPSDEVIRERGVVAGEYDMYQEQPMYRAQKLLSTAMFGDQSAGWQIIGTKKNILSFDRDDVVAWHSKWYIPQNSRLVIAGPMPTARIETMVNSVVGEKSAKTKVPKRLPVLDIQKEPVVIAQRAPSDQTHVCIAFRGIKRTDKNRHIAQVMSGILGAGMSSRLFVRLREDLGAGYYVSAHHIPYSDHGYIEIRFGIEGARTAEIVNEVLAECARLTTEPVSLTELTKIQNYIASHATMAMESSDAWAEYVGVQKLIDNDYEPLDDRIALLRSVTPAQIMAMAKKLLQPKNLTVVAYGDTTTAQLKKGTQTFITSS